MHARAAGGFSSITMMVKLDDISTELIQQAQRELGIDITVVEDDRFMKAAQYVAKYNLGNDVPFTTYTWGVAESVRPEGGGGDHGTTSGGFDQLGFGTVMYAK